MTPKQKVQKLWPEAWCAAPKKGTERYAIFRHSNWGVDRLGGGSTPAAAWKDAARRLS